MQEALEGRTALLKTMAVQEDQLQVVTFDGVEFEVQELCYSEVMTTWHTTNEIVRYIMNEKRVYE